SFALASVSALRESTATRWRSTANAPQRSPPPESDSRSMHHGTGVCFDSPAIAPLRELQRGPGLHAVAARLFRVRLLPLVGGTHLVQRLHQGLPHVIRPCQRRRMK